MKRTALALAALLAVPAPALAWGAQGHRLINGVAAAAFPSSLPAFLRTPQAHDEIELLGPEPDRIKGAGKPLDADQSPGHYADVSDDGTIDGIPLSALPDDEADYEKALEAKGTTMWAQGYLPYSIADGYERLVQDFAYWRADTAGLAHAPTAANRAFFEEDRTVREATILHDIGYWGHFVADASQPLHVSVHFNGWNSAKYPNPQGFSDSHTVHARFETDLVRRVATAAAVAARLPAPHPIRGPILAEVGAYLTATEAGVPEVYRLEAAGEIDHPDASSTAFVEDRLAAGAAELRDLVVDAWNASGDAKVGYPGTPVRDFETGAALPTPGNLGLGD